MTVLNCTLTGNAASFGGAIANDAFAGTGDAAVATATNAFSQPEQVYRLHQLP